MPALKSTFSSRRSSWWIAANGLLLSLLVLAGCFTSVPSARVRTGTEVLVARHFDLLRGKRVGLIANHTARIDTMHLIDRLMAEPEVHLVALFAPEHGLRGTAAAGEEIRDGRDVRTGLPVYSLYGATRKPTPEMLAGLDVLVFDLQDVGARCYTYISTLGLAMQAAAEAGIPFIVLDRPNPLGGELISGFVLEPEQASFVGLYPIPLVYGLTIGELARMIQGERLLPGLERLELIVVPLEGWRRTMQWPDTGLPWRPPSPNLPTFEAALAYPGTVFFEAVDGSEGRGTDAPFLQVGTPWANARALADTLNARGLPGVRFEPVTFTPRPRPGAPHPRYEGRPLHGVRLHITDRQTFRPVVTGIHLLHAFYHQAPPSFRNAFIQRPDWLARLAGTERLYELLRNGATPETIVASWEKEVEAFRQRRRPYLLY
ncbi:exo-beta-N-acetylmuramidase NamZ family protein [Rhodothermus marinus]|uniref:DUF1343 domain-containing protein n=1 Tax=Rhodothermus marinus (strain ATCC 43812 / DSM 4252 / R-10) TaxID=518766 RepID=D0MDV2_RHOM4|nr:DUF1343 domain-containing protein [Rhodothermus marinus]ACY49096.1 conserved hypothetical protein [Rhodothermus marinus DSM 4252]